MNTVVWHYKWQYDWQNTTEKNLWICERAYNFFAFLKLQFPSIFCWYFRYFVSERLYFQISNYISIHIQSIQFPFITYGMALWYKRQYVYKTVTFRKIYVYMRASELRKNLHFHIEKLLFLSIFCWYFRNFVGTKWHTCRLTCTDKLTNVPTKLRKSIIAPPPPPPPPPPSGYASAFFPWYKSSWSQFLFLETRISAQSTLHARQ